MTNDDPKLTAYALNELEETDRAEVETFLANNEPAHRFVEETRRTVALLTQGLQTVTPPTLTATQRQIITTAATAPALKAPALSYEPIRLTPRNRWAKWALATAACAALAAAGYLMFSGRQNPPRLIVQDGPISPTALQTGATQFSPATQPQLGLGASGGLTLNTVPSPQAGSQNGLDVIRLFAKNTPEIQIVNGGLAYSDQNQSGQQTGLQSIDATLSQSTNNTCQFNVAGSNTPTIGTVVLGGTLAGQSAPVEYPQKIGGKSISGTELRFNGGAPTETYGDQNSNGFTSGPNTGVPGSIAATGAGTSGEFRSLQTSKKLIITAGDASGKPYRTDSTGVGGGSGGRGGGGGSRGDSFTGTARDNIYAIGENARYNPKWAGDSALLPDGDLGRSIETDGAVIQLQRTATAPNESYAAINDNPFLPVTQQPLSTFSIDVDTGSYSNIRRFLSDGHFPPPDAVRIEEMLNYFPYHYETPKSDSKDPFAATVEIAACPWNNAHRLARVAIKGREIAHDKRPVSNLVFLIDVSGSMNEPAKLPLVKEGLKLMVNELTENDRISIVVYAGNAGLVLPSTTADPKSKQSIIDAIENLSAGGSTNGGQGIELAYKLATENFIKGGTNRVLLATDGDWNVGVTDQTSLMQLIQDKAKSGVFLSVLGYGFGNLKDSTMEKLADKGNGHYAYIDGIKEAKKVLIEEMSSTLVTIAKDVKIQVEFNPLKVESYRLIGYEKRLLRKEDFNNDKVDAGEIGAGHCVTALYEITPISAESKDKSAPATKPQQPEVDSLKYQKHELVQSDDLMTLKMRYKQPDGDQSTKLEFPAIDKGLSYSKASEDFKFSAAVAQFGMILRNSPHKGSATLDGVLELADEGKGKDEKGYRTEFLEMVKKAKALSK